MKNAKKKHHNHQNYKSKIPGKKGNKYQVSFPKFVKHHRYHSKKWQTHFPLKSSEILTLMHMLFKPRVASPPCAIGPAPRPWIDCIHDEESVDISLASRCLQWYFDIWCDDYVNISAIEFHHCHHVFVGYYLEYSWVFPSFFISNKDGHGIRMGAARFSAILNPHQCTAFLPIAMSEYMFFRKNNPETIVSQGIKCSSFPL